MLEMMPEITKAWEHIRGNKPSGVLVGHDRQRLRACRSDFTARTEPTTDTRLYLYQHEGLINVHETNVKKRYGL